MFTDEPVMPNSGEIECRGPVFGSIAGLLYMHFLCISPTRSAPFPVAQQEQKENGEQSSRGVNGVFG